MSAIPAEEQLLPPPDQVEVVEHLLGCTLSELDLLLQRVRCAVEPVFSLSELVSLRSAGVAECPERLDLDDLFRILRFASDAMSDAAAIRDQAEQILRVALQVIHTQESSSDSSDPESLRRREERVARWHREQARLWSGAA